VGKCSQGASGGENRAGYISNEEGDDDGQVEIDLMMENLGAPGIRTCVASSFSVDDWVEDSAPNDGPEVARVGTKGRSGLPAIPRWCFQTVSVAGRSTYTALERVLVIYAGGRDMMNGQRW
jgi:hypothetical protein